MDAKSKTIARNGKAKTKTGNRRNWAIRSPWFAPIILLGAFIFASLSMLWLIQANTHAAKQDQLVDDAESTAESIRLRLKGDQIPLAARLFAIVDVWDALRSDRPYRPGWPEEKVLEQIRSLAGTYFDPVVVKNCLELIAGR